MKIRCNACEAAEAAVMCCADEAALCAACDEKVHAANKLAGKHQRIPLLSAGSPSRVPKCDICQEAAAFFFCLEDRAVLCRKCDVSVHTANSYVSAHQRFLLTGVRVGLEPAGPVQNFPKEKSISAGKFVESHSKPLPKRSPLMSSYNEALEVFPSQVGKDDGLLIDKVPFSGATMPVASNDWPLDHFFGITDFNHNFGFTDHGSSKTDSGRLGISEGSPLHCSGDELDAGECLGEVPEIQWTVPEIPSPPTASGLHWQKNLQYPACENAVFVPDICSTPDPHRHNGTPHFSKRPRTY